VRPPLVTDYRAIIYALRRHGSVRYPRTAVPAEFVVWCRRLRQVARLAGVRMSVARGVGYVLIENCDFEVSGRTLTGAGSQARQLIASPNLRACYSSPPTTRRR
jgi:hypothetical protein